MTPEKVKLSDFLIEAPDKFVRIMNAIYGTDWLSYIRWRDGDHVADIISERLNIYYENIGGKRMNPEVELIKESDPEKVMAWDRLHDKRKTYRCHRCGAEWKCEYGANTFDTSHEYNMETTKKPEYRMVARLTFTDEIELSREPTESELLDMLRDINEQFKAMRLKVQVDEIMVTLVDKKEETE